MKPVPIGTLIDKLEKAKLVKKDASDRLKEAEAAYNELSAAILERLAEEGMEKASGKLATVSRSETLVGQIEDWETFVKFVGRTKNFQLFERRVSAAAFRELFGQKGTVPGLTPFTRITLRHTSIKGE